MSSRGSAEAVRNARPIDRRRLALIGAVLALLTLLAYAGTARNGFTTFDDEDYVTKNLLVQAGLTWRGVAWAFTTGWSANWHPLTWLSHMLDCELFGTNAAAHHLVSLALHVASALLLLYLLARTSGEIWPSAFVAAAFALHPLHVESVAWISERKDILSGLLWIATTLAYVRWVAEPKAARYLATLALCALGLLAKPMLVTLPFTLLLLDWWPLRRFDFGPRRAVIWRLVREKLPLFALAAASSVTTALVQRAAGAVSSAELLGFALRAQNAVVSYARYLAQALWPADLSAFYPHPGSPYPPLEVAVTGLALAAATAAALLAARARPWLAVGWLWFLGTLVPVIGLVQVGSQARADRYTYVPLIGLAIAVAWGGLEIARRWRGAHIGIALLSAIAVAGWAAATRSQVRYWKDDFTLFSRVKAVDPDNYLARGAIGSVHLKAGRHVEALAELREAVRLQPRFARGHNNIGMALELEGLEAQAIDAYEEALRWRPNLAEAHHNLAGLLVAQGRVDEAIAHYQSALAIRPDLAETHTQLAILLLARGREAEGIAHLERAVELDPKLEKAERLLQRARSMSGAVPP